MVASITCDVKNCLYNEEASCERKEIRVLSNTPETTANETISCMSFRASEYPEANSKPELAESHKG